MNQDYPELQQFLAGYFNQDWIDDHDSANDVINFFRSESSDETLTTVQLELAKLISTPKTEQELQHYLLFDIGCYYYYPNEWNDGRTWLKHVASALKNAQILNSR
ncbi:contact-dependent growth inhibition system immunity protein [Pseudomonas sp. R2-37-08W]|uniref:contact-dependent growth inhibition system immunity protein n=1 Tax=Pseudomonas sp. R2-37-08W TaxID=1173273 RepID=UPI000F570797|nr:contact-dependent growth inhibition system immunity protein [Pseudomonas sp. R2-37-08W]